MNKYTYFINNYVKLLIESIVNKQTIELLKT
nr:MAG TPA: hypothetical protein [Caudoviricetes sp.]DAP79369.1 MAG TPA: hypothetical protein [Caudoviricetes sp.]